LLLPLQLLNIYRHILLLLHGPLPCFSGEERGFSERESEKGLMSSAFWMLLLHHEIRVASQWLLYHVHTPRTDHTRAD
jgi:hypothetical protein